MNIVFIAFTSFFAISIITYGLFIALFFCLSTLFIFDGFLAFIISGSIFLISEIILFGSPNVISLVMMISFVVALIIKNYLFKSAILLPFVYLGSVIVLYGILRLLRPSYAIPVAIIPIFFVLSFSVASYFIWKDHGRI